jgi:hypothetical protein
VAPSRLTLAWSKAKDGQKTAILTTPLSPEWTVQVTFLEQDGRPVIHTLHITPSGPTPQSGLPTLLRELRLGDLLAKARRSLDSATTEATSEVAFLGKPPRTGRPRKLSDDYLAHVAREYERACESHPGASREVIAKQLKIEPNKARDHVNEARRRGFLTPGVHGKAVGRMTAKAKALLAGAQRTSKPPRRRSGRGRGTTKGASS